MKWISVHILGGDIPKVNLLYKKDLVIFLGFSVRLWNSNQKQSFPQVLSVNYHSEY
jgi:hypothetical protein